MIVLEPKPQKRSHLKLRSLPVLRRNHTGVRASQRRHRILDLDDRLYVMPLSLKLHSSSLANTNEEKITQRLSDSAVGCDDQWRCLYRITVACLSTKSQIPLRYLFWSATSFEPASNQLA